MCCAERPESPPSRLLHRGGDLLREGEGAFGQSLQVRACFHIQPQHRLGIRPTQIEPPVVERQRQAVGAVDGLGLGAYSASMRAMLALTSCTLKLISPLQGKAVMRVSTRPAKVRPLRETRSAMSSQGTMPESL